MIDWDGLRVSSGAPVTLRGKVYEAQPLSNAALARISSAHPRPGVPTEPDSKGDPVPVPQDSKYLGRVEAHARERKALETAAMLGYTASLTVEGVVKQIDIRERVSPEEARAWVAAALASPINEHLTGEEHYRVAVAVHAHLENLGAAAKKDSSSSPPD